MNIAIWGNELISWVAATAFAKAGRQVYFCPSAGANGNALIAPEAVNNEPGLIDALPAAV